MSEIKISEVPDVHSSWLVLRLGASFCPCAAELLPDEVLLGQAANIGLSHGWGVDSDAVGFLLEIDVDSRRHLRASVGDRGRLLDLFIYLLCVVSVEEIIRFHGLAAEEVADTIYHGHDEGVFGGTPL